MIGGIMQHLGKVKKIGIIPLHFLPTGPVQEMCAPTIEERATVADHRMSAHNHTDRTPQEKALKHTADVQ